MLYSMSFSTSLNVRILSVVRCLLERFYCVESMDRQCDMKQFPEANEIFNVFIVVFSTAQLFNIIPTRFHQHIKMRAVHDLIFESARRPPETSRKRLPEAASHLKVSLANQCALSGFIDFLPHLDASQVFQVGDSRQMILSAPTQLHMGDCR